MIVLLASDGRRRRTTRPHLPQKSKVGFSSGSGSFVSNEGHVLTSNHVIEDCTKIGVFMDQE
jgi:S1-C subfamily serine protease